MNNLTNGLVATLLLVSPLVGAETEYPAADFKPKVVYQDIDSSHAKSASTQQVKSAESDSRYPAADFEPKVLFKDDSYKPSKYTEATAASSAALSSGSEEAVVSSGVKAKEESMMTYLLGLVAFAIIGYIFLSKREAKSTVSDSKVYTKHVSGLSGVARYVRKHNMAAVTGVARYIESRVVSAKEVVAISGVEKYLAKQTKSTDEKKAQAGTGVEKYMRNRG